MLVGVLVGLFAGVVDKASEWNEIIVLRDTSTAMGGRSRLGDGG